MIAYAAVCAAFWLSVIGGTLGACRLVDAVTGAIERRRRWQPARR